MSTTLNILAASLGGGLLIGGKYQYQDWKAKRLLLTEAERNAGFWTDRRVKQADIAAWAGYALAVGAILAFGLWLVGLSWDWWSFPS